MARMKECKYCKGTGEIEEYREGYPKGHKVKCKSCKGFGKIYVAIRQV